jgi:hypothetical protein
MVRAIRYPQANFADIKSSGPLAWAGFGPSSPEVVLLTKEGNLLWWRHRLTLSGLLATQTTESNSTSLPFPVISCRPWLTNLTEHTLGSAADQTLRSQLNNILDREAATNELARWSKWYLDDSFDRRLQWDERREKKQLTLGAGYQQELEPLQHLLHLAPHNPENWMRIAEAHLRIPAHLREVSNSEILHWVEQAVVVAPQDPKVARFLATVREQLGH